MDRRIRPVGHFDLLIQGGRVADGTGNPLFRHDVGVIGDRIAAVGNLDGATAARVISAAGLVVAPGFVDPHSHSDRSLLSNPTAQSTIRQGVTTEVVGNCGTSMAPRRGAAKQNIDTILSSFGYEEEPRWETFGEYLKVVQVTCTSQNLAFLVGHNAIRGAAGVTEVVPTESQLGTMRGFLREALEAGAIGMSSGLEFQPGRWAATEELIALNQVVGEYAGIYTSHVRNRDSALQDSTEEFLAIVAAGRTRGQYSHLNVRANTGARPGAWAAAVQTLEKAREAGLEVLADTTPFPDGVGRMQAILPSWVLADGSGRAQTLLRDPSVRRRLRSECDRYWRFIHRGEFHRVRLMDSQTHAHLNGRNFVEIGAELGMEPWDAFFEILAEAGPGMEDLHMVGHLFTEEHLREMVAHPLFCLGVDSWTAATDGPTAKVSGHPIAFAGHAHYLTYHVREMKTLSIEEAIRKMTSMPATQFGLVDRGRLTVGCYADIVAFDYDRLQDKSTTAEPLQYVEGVRHVIVNGSPVVADGEHLGNRPGRILRHGEGS